MIDVEQFAKQSADRELAVTAMLSVLARAVLDQSTAADHDRILTSIEDLRRALARDDRPAGSHIVGSILARLRGDPLPPPPTAEILPFGSPPTSHRK